MNVVFFGTPTFAAQQLNYLLNNGVQVAAVVTKPDRPHGRSKELLPSPVKQAALAHNPPLPLFQPLVISDPASAELLRPFEADLFVVVAFGEIIKENLLTMPKMACINLHASLLPKYRGAAPIQRCLIEGATESGVTIMHMVKKMDAGDIISQQRLPLDNEITFGALEERLCQIGAPLLLKAIRDLAQGRATRTPQRHEEATYAPKIELEDCQINWIQPAEQVHNLVRGVNPHPGAWCMVEIKGEPKRLRVLKTRVLVQESSTPGEIISSIKEGLAIACGQQSVLLQELQLEGKKAMTAAEFLRGVPLNAMRML